MKKLTYLFMLAAFATVIYACGDDMKPDDTVECNGATPTYDTDMMSIISGTCAIATDCHGSGSVNGAFTSYENMEFVLNKSKLETRILIDQDMPPTGPLNDELLTLFQCWADNGYPEN